MAKNEYAKRLQAKRRDEDEVIWMWAAQLSLDVMAMVLNDPDVMGRDVFGKDRLMKLADAFNVLYAEGLVGLTKRVEASYVREKIDERLVRIFGPEFERWPERYHRWNDRGI